jgi:hypothetical protein
VAAVALLVWNAGARQLAAQPFTARQLVDHLYSPNGQLPIQTLIVELDGSAVVSPDHSGQGGGSNLVPASHDKIFFKKPNLLHVESIIVDPNSPLNGKQLTIIRDGTNRWMFMSEGEYPVKKGTDEPSPTAWLPFHIQLYPQDLNKQYTLLGADPAFGPAARVVRITDPTAPKKISTVWIDTVRWVPLCWEFTKVATHVGDKDAKYRIVYHSFKQLPDGRWFPFSLERYENGALAEAGVYKAVAVNEELPSNLFEPMGHFVH